MKFNAQRSAPDRNVTGIEHSLQQPFTGETKLIRK
jgi:hypothetical protein